MLLFPPFLGGEFFHVDAKVLILSLSSFCLASSSVYIINDILDIKQDIHHPVKSRRPIPSGKIKVFTAFFLACVLLILSAGAAAALSKRFLVILIAYIIISNAYSLFLKSVALIEIFCIVIGFLLRLQAGGFAFNVPISEWLFLSVFLLALFLVTGKRLSELKHAEGESPDLIRPVLIKYPDGFFQGAMYIAGSAVLVTYAIYVIDHKSNILLIPLCCFGLLQYCLRVLAGRGGDPTRALIREPLLLVVGITWVIMTGMDIYLQARF